MACKHKNRRLLNSGEGEDNFNITWEWRITECVKCKEQFLSGGMKWIGELMLVPSDAQIEPSDEYRIVNP